MKLKPIIFIPFLLVSLLLISFSHPFNGEVRIIEIENLNPELFKDYMLSSLENSDIEIIEACVPAKLICAKFTGETTSDETEVIVNFFKQLANSGEVKNLTNYSMTDFQERCGRARLGK
ncbi:MAG: hypothetical protein ACI8QW_000835 [Saprospiraceae bacterium]|jgi:hypothetical protein